MGATGGSEIRASGNLPVVDASLRRAGEAGHTSEREGSEARNTQI